MKTKTTNVMLQYKSLVASIRIDHVSYTAILDRLIEAIDEVGFAPVPTCLHLIGETRTGKSSVVKDFLDRYRVSTKNAENQQSVVVATAPPKATVKSLLEQLLKGLGDPHWSRGTESNMADRLHTMLRSVSCRMIVIDEFQHLCDKGQQKRLALTSDFLKALVEENAWGLVAVGLPSSASVINANAQLAGRFDATLKMPLFDWRDPALKKQFKAILISFGKQLAPFELPDFKNDENALRMYLATSGRLGLVAKLIDRAVQNAIRKSTYKIRHEDLEVAFQGAIWYAQRFPIADGPFGADLALYPSMEVIGQVLDIATEDLYEDNSGTVTVIKTNTPKVPEAKVPKKSTKANHAKAMAVAL